MLNIPVAGVPLIYPSLALDADLSDPSGQPATSADTITLYGQPATTANASNSPAQAVIISSQGTLASAIPTTAATSAVVVAGDVASAAAAVVMPSVTQPPSDVVVSVSPQQSAAAVIDTGTTAGLSDMASILAQVSSTVSCFRPSSHMQVLTRLQVLTSYLVL